MKKLLSWILVLALCLSLFPCVALAEDAEEPVGEIAPVEEPVPSLEGDDGGLSGTPAPTEEDQAGALAGDGVLGVPSAVPEGEPVASGSCGADLNWAYYENGLLDITGSGSMNDWTSTYAYQARSAPWYQYRDSITELQLPEGLTGIGSYAFCECKYITRLEIPASVTSIGNNAFDRCSGLRGRLQLPPGLTVIAEYAFSNCGGLTGLSIPNGVTRIERSAFSSCFGLTELSIPDSVTSIGEWAFQGCSGLSRVTIPSSVTSIGEDAFSYWHDGAVRVYIDDLDWWLVLTDSWGSDLPHGDLYLNGELLEEITVPEGTLTLRPGMFRNARSLKRIQLPESLRSIGNSAFRDCRGLTELSLPAGVTGVGNSAFQNCTNLTELTLPAGMASIGESTFSGCSSLRSITIPDSVTSIGFGAFQMCTSLTEVRIPAEVTGIGDNAFYGCNSLRRVDFLGDVPSISSSAFSGWFDADTNTDYHVRAFALYPLENETWTEDLLQNYGGTLSWVPYRDGEAGTPIAYALRFDPYGGEGGPELQYKGRGVDLTLSETEPSRDYYRFQGWAEEAEADAADFLPGQSYGEDRELSLYAVWTPRTWELQYALNGGQGGPESQIKTYGAALTLPDTVPTREGFEFLGWSTKFGDSVPSYFPGDSFTEEGEPRGDGPITLYAVWQIKLFLVSYHPNGGEDAPPPQLKTYGRALTLSTDIPRRTGYTFLGWSKSRSAAEPDYLPGDRFTENADRVLYAVWQRGDQGQPTQASLTPRDAAGCIGAEFTVDLMLEKNPGLMFLSFTLDYDDAVLEFLGAEDGVLSGWTVVPAENSLVWDSDRDHTENGCVLHLRFRAKAGLEPGTVRLGVKDLFAANYNEERLQIQAGTGLIRLADRLPGDVNGDGTVDGLDLIRLRKYLAGVADTEIVEANAKVNGDDTIDLLDLVRLRKYLAKDKVILE